MTPNALRICFSALIAFALTALILGWSGLGRRSPSMIDRLRREIPGPLLPERTSVAADLARLSATVARLDAALASLPSREAPRAKFRSEVRRLARAMAGSGDESALAHEALGHLLEQTRYDQELSVTEALCSPERERAIPEFLDANGLSLSAEQRATFEVELRAFEIEWRDYCNRRAQLLPLERAAEALSISFGFESRFFSQLTEAQARSWNGTRTPSARLRRTPAMVMQEWVMVRRDPAERESVIIAVEGSILGDLRIPETQRGLVRQVAMPYADGLIQLERGPHDTLYPSEAPVPFRIAQLRLQAAVLRSLLDAGGWTKEEALHIRNWSILWEPWTVN